MDAWSKLVSESIISCKTCGKKIWKYWHTGSKKIFPEMSLCAPCQFNIYRNPLKVRKLSELEMAKCKVLLEQLKEKFDPGEKLIAKGNLNNV